MRALGARLIRSASHHPIVVTWLIAQLLVVLCFGSLERVASVRDHHLGATFMAIMAVLLFPGGQIVMYALAIPFRGAEALGHPLYVHNQALAALFGLALWATSALITLRFWTWLRIQLSRGELGPQGPPQDHGPA